jgi:hypothetical protein
VKEPRPASLARIFRGSRERAGDADDTLAGMVETAATAAVDGEERA